MCWFCHEIQLDNARHSVTVSSTPVELTYKEYCLLRLLLENHQSGGDPRDHFAGSVGHRHLGGKPYRGYAHPHPAQKLGDAGRYICTVRKVGYKLTDEEAEEE